jgi:hypothetical protein
LDGGDEDGLAVCLGGGGGAEVGLAVCLGGGVVWVARLLL